MMPNFSPWSYSLSASAYPYYFGSPFAQGFPNLPLGTYFVAATVGSWFEYGSGYGYGTGAYIPGWANRFFADRVYPLQQPGGNTAKGRPEYIADLKKKGFKDSDAVAVYDKLLAGKTDSEIRLAMDKMGEVNPDKVDAQERAKQYEQNVRVAAMRVLDVKNEEELNALYGKHKDKNLSDFLDAMRRDVESGNIPKAASARGGRGGRHRS